MILEALIQGIRLGAIERSNCQFFAEKNAFSGDRQPREE